MPITLTFRKHYAEARSTLNKFEGCVGRKADAKTILIIEGLYLKRISSSPNWQASYQLRNTYLRKSTGTADERQSTIAALEWFFLLRQRVELGIRFQAVELV